MLGRTSWRGVSSTTVLVSTEIGTWYSRLRAAAVRETLVAAAGDDSTFLADHLQRGMVPHAFRKWGMLAVEVDFRRVCDH